MYHSPRSRALALPRFVVLVGALPIALSLSARQRPSEVAPLHESDTIRQQHLTEIVTTARRRAVGNERVSTSLNADQLEQRFGHSLSGALEDRAGMASLQTGATAAKPILHGMHGNRLLIVNNGARQTGQQWGLDHAPEIDLNAAGSVQIVKGAESVRYGADALGGVILLEQSTLPFDSTRLHGYARSLYETNGRRVLAAGGIEGQLARSSNWAWRLQGSWGNGGDRSSARYLLNNTGTREANLHSALGWRRGAFRAEVYYSLYHNKAGVMYGAQLGNEDLLKERIALGAPAQTSPFSRAIDYPYQKVTHHNATLHLHYTHPQWGTWYGLATYQNDHRAEHRFRRLNRSEIPAVALHLNSWQYLLRWRKSYGTMSTEVGGQLVSLRNRNEEGTGVVPIIPNYTETSVGLYALQRWRYASGSVEGGVRLDHQTTKAAGYDWTGTPYGGTKRFTNFTYNVGWHQRLLPYLKFTSNFGVAWRAPHVYELYSNGNELGSGIFVRGNESLQSESSYKWISGLQYEHGAFDLSLSAYVQWIDNYIYDQPMQRNIVVASGAYPLFAYGQTRALFRGVDAEVSWQMAKALRYQATFSAVYAHEVSTGAYLPFIPSERISHELDWQLPTWRLCATARPWQPQLTLRHRWVARQRRFNPAADLIGEAPASYHLVDAEISLTRRWQDRQQLRLSVVADNLLNQQYKEYTNRARYYAHDLGRNVRMVVGWHF